MSKRTEDTIKRLFIHDSDPTPAPRVGLDVNALVFSFRDGTGEEVERITFNFAQVFGGTLPPPGVGRAAAAFGINTSAGNAGNTVKGEGDAAATLADRIEAVKARLETFSEGRWESERPSATGPRTTLVLEAIKLALERAGKTADLEKIETSLKADPNLKVQYLGNAAIRLAYEDIRDKRRAEMRKKLEADAANATLDL